MIRQQRRWDMRGPRVKNSSLHCLKHRQPKLLTPPHVHETLNFWHDHLSHIAKILKKTGKASKELSYGCSLPMDFQKHYPPYMHVKPPNDVHSL